MLQSVSGIVQAHPYLVITLHLGIVLAALIGARAELREEWRRAGWRFHALCGGCALLGLVVAALVIPALTRHGFEGHESFYLDVFLGRDNEEMHSSPLLTAPLLRMLYLALAAIPGMPPASMVVVNLLIGAACVWIAGQLGRAMTGDRTAGVITAGMVALHPHQACWSSSAYQIILPLLLVLCAVLVLVLAIQRASWLLYAAAAGLWTLAVATRIETVFLGPGLAILVLLAGRQTLRDWRTWSPAVGLAVAMGAVHLLRLGGTVAERDAGEPWAYYLGYFREHVLWPDLWHPYDAISAWPALLAGVVVLARGGRWRVLAGIAAVIVTFHLPYTVYYDYTTRHTLLSVVLLAVVGGMGVAHVWNGMGILEGVSARILAAALLVGCLTPSLVTLSHYRARYYADSEQLVAAVDRSAWENRLDLDTYLEQGCYLITEWPNLWERTACGSHVNLADPLDRPQILEEHDGCVLWLYDVDNVVWTSRDVHMRAAKQEWLYDWELIGSIVLEDGYEAAVKKLVLE